MSVRKFIIAILAPAIIWYFIGVFISLELNPLEWSVFGKIMYLILWYVGFQGISEELNN